MVNSTRATFKKAKNHMPYDLAFLIMSKLPLKSLKRFGCLCKSWDLHFENPHFMTTFRNNFISNHHSYYDDTSLLLSVSNYLVCSLYSLFGEKFENKHKLEWPNTFPEHNNGFLISDSGSITGTLCLLGDDGKIVFWNPAIKEFKAIPLSPYVPSRYSMISFHGFGFDNVGDDYKLIRRVDLVIDPYELIVDDFGLTWEDLTEEEISFEPFWEIYSLRSNSWKKLDGGDIAPSSNHSYYGHSSQLYIEGMCHWWGLSKYNTDTEKRWLTLSSFDLGNEVFIATPISSDTHLYLHLIVLNGSIALISLSSATPISPTYHISVLGELGVKESWTKLFIIGPLPYNDGISIYGGIPIPIGVWKKGDLFFRKRDGEILYFDLTTGMTHEIDMKGFYCHTIVVYKESFIPILRNK